jgi:hypothetical protein
VNCVLTDNFAFCVRHPCSTGLVHLSNVLLSIHLTPCVSPSLLLILVPTPTISCQGVVSRLQYSTCRIERIFLVHILHALFGSSTSNAPCRSRAVRNRVETAVAVALTSLVDETLATLRKVHIQLWVFLLGILV